MYRDRLCMRCEHAWTEEIRLGSPVSLTGEMHVYCPKCQSGEVMSKPAYSNIDTADVTKRVRQGLRVWGVNCNVGVVKQPDEPNQYAIKVDTCGHVIGNFDMTISELPRLREVKTITTTREVLEWRFIAEVEIMCDGGYNDPPYSDVVETASELCPVMAILTTIFNEVERRAFEAQAPLPEFECEEMPW